MKIKNQIYKFILNNGKELKNVNTKHWPCYEYDQIIDRETLEKNIAQVTILRDNGTKYTLKDKMLNQYMITSNQTTRFNFKGPYDFTGVHERQQYAIELKDGTILENVVVIQFPYYEYNAIIEKDVLENNTSKIIIMKDNKILYTLYNRILSYYCVKNGHTLFQIRDPNDENIEKERKYNFTLANGTKLYDINTRYFQAYDYEDVIEEDVLAQNLSELTIQDTDGNTQIYHNQILYDYHIRNGHTLFRIRNKSQEDINQEKLAQFYYKLIKGESPTIDDVPSNIKKEVLKLMNQ